MSTPIISEPSPELISSITRQIFFELQNSSAPPSTGFDPVLVAQSNTSTASTGSSTSPSIEERISAIEEALIQINGRSPHREDDADDEGDGSPQPRGAGYQVGGIYRELSSAQKAARNELSRRIRQVMKALARRAGAPGIDDEEAEEVLPVDEHGFIPDYDKTPKFPTNESFIVRTVELVLSEFEPIPETGQFSCDEVPFTKKDCYYLATRAFVNKKRTYQTEWSVAKKKKVDRAKRSNRRHLCRRQMKNERAKQAEAYFEKFRVKLPHEIFQSDCMTDLVSELDSTDISSPSAAEASAAEGDDTTRKAHIQAKRAEHFAQLAAHASLAVNERRRKIKLWEEKKPAFRSNKLNRVYKCLDKLADKQRKEEQQELRRWAWCVSIGGTTTGIPKCRKIVWPFMVDKAWLADDGDFKKARWTKLQRADPEGLNLEMNTDSDSSDHFES